MESNMERLRSALKLLSDLLEPIRTETLAANKLWDVAEATGRARLALDAFLLGDYHSARRRPVAWRSRQAGRSDWKYHDGNPSRNEDGDYEWEPLYVEAPTEFSLRAEIADTARLHGQALRERDVARAERDSARTRIVELEAELRGMAETLAEETGSAHFADPAVDVYGANFLAGARMLADEHAHSFAKGLMRDEGVPGKHPNEVIGLAALDMQLLAERVARMYAKKWPHGGPPHCPSCGCAEAAMKRNLDAWLKTPEVRAMLPGASSAPEARVEGQPTAGRNVDHSEGKS